MDLPLQVSSIGKCLQKEQARSSGSNCLQSPIPNIQRPSSSNSIDNEDAVPISPNGSNLVKLVILGAPKVGKTSIIQQFVWGVFESRYFPTERKETYYPSVIHREHHYELKIVDIPDLPFFPVNSFYNLSDLQSYGLRDATAYVLVFDLLSPESFEYISRLYAQIIESRNVESIPIIVIGNKVDKAEEAMSIKRPCKKHCHRHQILEESHIKDHVLSDIETPSSLSSPHPTSRHSLRRKKKSYKVEFCTLKSEENNLNKETYFRKDIAELVISEWKATYREIAAKDSESVTDLFRAIMEQVLESTEEYDSKLNKKCIIV